MSAAMALAPDAAMALGIASTAMPFARTSEAQAERWLRILRLHGQAGIALQALGVGEARLQKPGEVSNVLSRSSSIRLDDRDVVAQVSIRASRIAGRRGAAGVTTTDLLLAVMCVYGAEFDRVLAAHGADPHELVERLGVDRHSAKDCEPAR